MRAFTSGLSNHMARRHSGEWSYFLTPTPLRAQEIPQEEDAKKKGKLTAMQVNILGYKEELWEKWPSHELFMFLLQNNHHFVVSMMKIVGQQW